MIGYKNTIYEMYTKQQNAVYKGLVSNDPIQVLCF